MPFGSSPKAPKPPPFTPPPPYQQPNYTPTPGYQAPPDPQTVIPGVLSGGQVMDQGSQVESQLPQWLQLNNNPMDPAGLQQYQDRYYQQNINPAIQQALADTSQSGQQWGSFGGAAVGQLAAQGQLDKYNAGLNYANQLFGNQVQGRQSYFAGGPTVAAAQNAANVARGTNVAQLQSGNANALNSFNLNNTGMANDFALRSTDARNNYGFAGTQAANNFGLDNYHNQLQAYQLQNQQKAYQTQGLLGLGQGAVSMFGGPIGHLASAGFGAARGFFGGPAATPGFGGGFGAGYGASGSPSALGVGSGNPFPGSSFSNGNLIQ